MTSTAQPKHKIDAPESKQVDAYLKTVPIEHLMHLKGVNGKHLVARFLLPEDPIGLEGCLRWGHEHPTGKFEKQPGLEFWDFDQDKNKFGPLGQFTGGRYFLVTLVEYRGYESGLSLQGGTPEWSIDKPEMNRVKEWAKALADKEMPGWKERTKDEVWAKNTQKGAQAALASIQASDAQNPFPCLPLALAEKVKAMQDGAKVVLDDAEFDALAATKDQGVWEATKDMTPVPYLPQPGLWLCWNKTDQDCRMHPANQEAVTQCFRGERSVFVTPVADGTFMVVTKAPYNAPKDFVGPERNSHLLIHGIHGELETYKAAIDWVNKFAGIPHDFEEDLIGMMHGTFSIREMKTAFNAVQVGHWKDPQQGDVEGPDAADLLAAAFEHYHGTFAKIVHHGGTNRYTVSTSGYAAD